jgi:hypothetical protein
MESSEDISNVGDLLSIRGGITFDHSIDICPDCYARRDVKVPIFTLEFQTAVGAYARLPDGERVGEMPSVQVAGCLVCRWSEVKS